jgi:hypothetical protein
MSLPAGLRVGLRAGLAVAALSSRSCWHVMIFFDR